MPEYLYTLKQIGEITGKSNTSLFRFINENSAFIKEHSQKNGRFIKYDEDALQLFINRFGRVYKQENEVDFLKELSKEQVNQDSSSEDSEFSNGFRKVDKKERKSVIEAFEKQIEFLKKECEELTVKLEARERDCAEWRFQAGQALNALSKEQERVERLEERLAGYLPTPRTQSNDDKIVNKEISNSIKRKLSFKERIKILFGFKT